jgi:hypothetical protein
MYMASWIGHVEGTVSIVVAAVVSAMISSPYTIKQMNINIRSQDCCKHQKNEMKCNELHNKIVWKRLEQVTV